MHLSVYPLPISTSNFTLKVLQKKVAGLIERYHGGKIHGCANAFYKGRSILTNARPHLGCEVLIKLDIVDFFPSVNREHAKNSLRFKGMPLLGTAEAPDLLENRLLEILFLDQGCHRARHQALYCLI